MSSTALEVGAAPVRRRREAKKRRIVVKVYIAIVRIDGMIDWLWGCTDGFYGGRNYGRDVRMVKEIAVHILYNGSHAIVCIPTLVLCLGKAE